ncbi:MAG: penicillin acylase family protein [Acidobacteria bacterium]|nr:penicillin acylase family protein [Acidobacteriota bacterium]
MVTSGITARGASHSQKWRWQPALRWHQDDGEWTGYIPFDKLPHVYDPPSGMIVTANSRVVGKDYPYHLTYGWSVP